MSKDYWDRDDIQFPRLLAEIKAVGLSPKQTVALSVSMNISPYNIHEILDRAEETWDCVKCDLTFVDETCIACNTKFPPKKSDAPKCGAV
jgi:hypothetical protein